ncbi:MAG: hypothetical protein RR825_02460 [Ruthenibacterium sp.]
MKHMLLGETTLTQTEKEAADGMLRAAREWMDLFCGKAPWLLDGSVQSLNLPCAVAGELARLVTVEQEGRVCAPMTALSLGGARKKDGLSADNFAQSTGSAQDGTAAPATSGADTGIIGGKPVGGAAQTAAAKSAAQAEPFAAAKSAVQADRFATAKNAAFGAATVSRAQTTQTARADFLQARLDEVLRVLRTQCEYAVAGGSLVMKPYVSNGRLCVDFVRADGYIPTQWDSAGEVTGAVFLEQLARPEGWYTRFERHTMLPNGCHVENSAFYSATRGALGAPVRLSAVPQWAALAPEWTVCCADGTAPDGPLFAVFKMPFANQLDPSSPVGVSAYSRATNLMEQADRQYSRILWEYEGSELAVDASVGAVLTEDGRTRLPRTAQRLFRELGIDHGDGGDLYSVFSPVIRDESLFNGLENLLRRIEFACYLSYGTLSNVQQVEKTAEEIKMSRQRSYSAVCDMQKSLAVALTKLVRVMDLYASLYQLAPQGAYETSFSFGDAVATDTSAEREAMRADCRDGAAAWWEYRMRFYGESESEARRRADEAAKHTEPEPDGTAAQRCDGELRETTKNVPLPQNKQA